MPRQSLLDEHFGKINEHGIPYGTLMFTEGEFEVRAGLWSYFIEHAPDNGACYTTNMSRRPVARRECTECGARYPTKLEVLIKLLDSEIRHE